jgi:hypothetical protein
MERVNKYIDRFILRTITEKGFVFLSDDYLFVQDKISYYLKDLNLPDITGLTRILRKEKLIHILNEIKKIDKRPFELEILINYQEFLDENKFDNRHKKQVRKILTQCLLENNQIKEIREKYFYISSTTNLVFIDSINDLITNVKEQLESNKDLFYRGHANLNWDLKPSIYRQKTWIENEHNMFREILIRNPIEFSQTKSAFEKLTIMQHYGLPTRLLDITKNPLVAMYFVCSDKSQLHMPGEVFVFAPEPRIIKFYDSDTVSILSNLSKVERNIETNKTKAEFNENYYEGLKLLHLIKEEKPYFLAEVEPSDFNKTLIVKPINNNERIKRQLGYFFIFGIETNIYRSAEIDFAYKKGQQFVKFIVEDSIKNDILTELETIGISSNTLFPEIDNGTEYIKSKY